MAGQWKVMAVMGLAIVAVSIGETLASQGMKEIGGGGGAWSSAREMLGNGHVLGGLALMLGYLALFVVALGMTDLSLAVPLTAASYPLGAVLARFYLGEDVSLARWIGTAVITCGVLVAGFGDLASQ